MKRRHEECAATCIAASGGYWGASKVANERKTAELLNRYNIKFSSKASLIGADRSEVGRRKPTVESNLLGRRPEDDCFAEHCGTDLDDRGLGTRVRRTSPEEIPSCERHSWRFVLRTSENPFERWNSCGMPLYELEAILTPSELDCI